MNWPFKSYNNSTYAKVITLLTLVSVGLLALVLALYFYMRVQEKQIFDSSNKIYDNEINTLLKLNSESYTSLTIDVTYWDEFVDFIETRNLNWFNTSVANVIDAYKLEYVCAYTVEGELITKVSTSKIKTAEIIPQEAIKFLLEERISHFYLKIPEGVVEVFGATIHPSNDPFKNKTNPAGCFFMIRLLDNEYFADIRNISTSNIKFTQGEENPIKTVYSFVPLLDFNGKEVAKLYFERAYKIDFWITKSILLIMAVALIISWFIYFIYANRWSKIPLSFIKKILVDGDQSAINSLKNIKGEFRYIGKLFEENRQKTNELEIAKNKAEESDKLKSAFLMNLSHEIRTPMNAILGFSDLLSHSNLSKEQQEEYVRIIQLSGKNLVEIIDDLVEMSKIDSNLIKASFSSFYLNEILDPIINSFSLLNTNSKIEFKVLPFDRPFEEKIISDKVKLSEILNNLLTNAFKFTEEGFVVLDYDLDEVNQNIIFSVKDSGIGIPDNFQQNIFKRFSKINAKAISANEGLGLGLAICKAYVEMLGGTISFQSQENVGSTFTFTIPLQLDNSLNANAKDSLEVKMPIDLGNEEVILIAEDDNINFLLIQKMLEPFNCKIIRAKDGVEAVEFCKTNSEIDLVLMDIKMPNMNGYDAFVEIRKFNTNLPIIAQTSFSYEEEINKIKTLGFNGFISKPLDKNKLLDMVKIYLKRS